MGKSMSYVIASTLQAMCQQIGLDPLTMVDVIGGEAYCPACRSLAEDHLIKESI